MNFLLWKIIKNDKACAKFDYFIWKHFHIKTDNPCGRRKGDSFLSCCLPVTKEYCKIYKDKETSSYCVRCKRCGRIRVMSCTPYHWTKKGYLDHGNDLF